MASSSSSSRNYTYDVFPSFSGEDVRTTFLSHFLKELERKMIIAFRDNMIERGKSMDPELKQAIRDSKIAVVFFSERYASSSWCLDELVEILKCKVELGQVVITIFYNLDPSYIRKQTGKFGKFFKETCRNKNEAMKKRWQQALSYAANIAGYHSTKWDNEAKMIEEIANDILGKLMSLTRSKDFEEFVGIEEHIADMTSLLHLESEEVIMVGIWGSSGIGKTTIARALFSRLSHRFQNSVFIDKAFISKSKEIYNRGNSDEYSMKLHLQENFLFKILDKKDIRVDHLGAMGERLKHQKVLIILDDLDDQVVLDALAGRSQWFGRGSRIIVITKDVRILKAHEIHHIYEVSLPSKKLALEMLCQAAFKQTSPPDGFKELASKVVERAGSLPLGLNVLGSNFRGRDKKHWMDMLSRLQTGLDKKIEETLRASYNGINDKKDEAIFRHVACLFNGEKIDDIKQLLADTYLNVNIGLENLVDKSLIHVRWNNVEMHPLLQEMGKEIVRTQSDKPGKREFLFDSKDICDLLVNTVEGTKKLLGISFDIAGINELLRVHEKAFKMMLNLRFLKIFTKSRKSEVKLHLPEDLNYLPSTLRLLWWDGYPVKCLPSKFCPESLVKLKLRESKLEKLWEGVQSLACLKDMDLWGSKHLKELPDLSKATNLEKMDLSYCSSLVELPSFIRNLRKLTNLVMAICTDLETLSTVINSVSLNVLNLNGCSLVKSFPGISNKISELPLPQGAIEEVPWWMNFSRLNQPMARKLYKIKYISPNIKHLEKPDFSMYGALSNRAKWHDGPSSVSMEIHTKLPLLEDSSCSICVPKAEFINCFNLVEQSFFKVIVLLGDVVPSYYTHPTIGSSLDIPLFNNSLSEQFFRFRACLALEDGSTSYQLHSIRILVFYCLRGTRNNFHSAKRRDVIFVTPLMYKHMVILDYRIPQNEDNDGLVEVNYDQVYIRFHISRGSFQIEGCGERSNDCPCPGNPNVLEHVCEANEHNMVDDDGCHETEHVEECGENGVETKRKRKRIKVKIWFRIKIGVGAKRIKRIKQMQRSTGTEENGQSRRIRQRSTSLEGNSRPRKEKQD